MTNNFGKYDEALGGEQFFDQKIPKLRPGDVYVLVIAAPADGSDDCAASAHHYTPERDGARLGIDVIEETVKRALLATASAAGVL